MNPSHGLQHKVPPRGFTLLETLLAVLVFSLVAGAAYGTLDSMTRAARASSQSAERLRAVQTALQRFENEVRQTLATGMQAGLGSDTQATFNADGQAIEFQYLAAPLGPGGPRLAAVRHQFQGGQWHRLPVSGPVVGGTLLLDDVEQFAFSYLDRNGRWLPDWRGHAPGELPLAVRLDFQASGFGRVLRILELPGDQR